MRVLLDTNATTAAIYNGFDWLKQSCEQDQQQHPESVNTIYFYFSGHGDVETATVKELGFLLAFNTPGNNYINNAVRLEDLNYYASTLSTRYRAKVIIITDACHSGKLAGSDFNSSFLVGKALTTSRTNEIRITSCAPEQLSQEDEGWGGGRGVFSYYLIDGLQGRADYDRDRTVTLSEIQRYLDSSISNDAIMKANRYVQNPVTKGVSSSAIGLLRSVDDARIFPAPVQSSLSVTEQFFHLLTRDNNLERNDFSPVFEVAADAIIPSLLNSLDTAIAAHINIRELQRAIEADEKSRRLFRQRFAEIIHNRVQKIINLYLEGDQAELEKRRYYNSNGISYHVYPALCRTALKLIEPDHPLSRVLRLNQLYFEGVLFRLRIPLTPVADQRKLIDSAMQIQQRAVLLQPNAAYIHNELGILFQYQGKLDSAASHYNQAIDLSPSWAIPIGNLGGIHLLRKKYDQSRAASEAALEKQPGLINAINNLAATYEVANDYLVAEEFYRRSIDSNNRDYLAYEQLAHLYLREMNYHLADSFFHEAAIRKKGYYFSDNPFQRSVIAAPAGNIVPGVCEVSEDLVKPGDMFGYFALAIDAYYRQNFKLGESSLKQMIAIDPRNPLAYYYLGHYFYRQHRYEEADLYLRFAEQYRKSKEELNLYIDSIVRGKRFIYDHTCVEQMARDYNYSEEQNLYLLAAIAESSSRYEQAASFYRRVVPVATNPSLAYILLYRMYERAARWTEAEQALAEMQILDKATAGQEMNAFYRRAIEVFPDDASWYYKTGMLLREIPPSQRMQNILDTIIYFPKLNREIAIDESNQYKLGDDFQWDILATGARPIPHITTIVRMQQKWTVPGTDSAIIVADPVATPRLEAIFYLKKADSLTREPEQKAAIETNIGRLYIRCGSHKLAIPWFERSVLNDPANADTRSMLASSARKVYQNRKALEQLDSLYSGKQLGFEERLLFAELAAYNGRYAVSSTLITEAAAMYPHSNERIEALAVLPLVLQNKHAIAIVALKKLYSLRNNDKDIAYSIARFYRQSGNSKEAWLWLTYAINNQFRYIELLEADPVWKDVRNTTQWKQLSAKWLQRTN